MKLILDLLTFSVTIIIFSFIGIILSVGVIDLFANLLN